MGVPAAMQQPAAPPPPYPVPNAPQIGWALGDVPSDPAPQGNLKKSSFY